MSERKGILITNAFLKTEKFVEHYDWLCQAAREQSVILDRMDNAACLPVCGGDMEWLAQYDFVLFWDKDFGLGKELTRAAGQLSIPVFNSVDAIAASDDKFETYHRIGVYNQNHPESKLRLMPTIMAPMTYSNIGYTSLEFLDQVERTLGYPVVVKECFGSFGMQVYLAQNRLSLEKRTMQLAGKPFLYQKYEAYSAGKDVRLQVVGNQVVAAMYRYARNGDFRANITNGGSMEPYEPSDRECAIAVQAAKILGLDFAGIDLLFSEKSGEADIFCEANSNAHFKNIYTCTGINVAEHIMKYIVERL